MPSKRAIRTSDKFYGALIMITVASGLCIVGCGEATDSAGKGNTIKVPYVNFGVQPMPGLDHLLETVSPGETISVELVITNPNKERNFHNGAFEVEQGSVTFFTKDGYFRFLPNNRVAVKPSKGAEEKTYTFSQGPLIELIYYPSADGVYLPPGVSPKEKMVATWMLFNLKEKWDSAYHVQLISKGTDSFPIVISLSSDFRGRISPGWVVYHPL